MGVLYNVELVNCVLCDDGDELFLFYDLAVCEMNNSNLQSKGVFCVLLCWFFFFFLNHAEAIRRFTVCIQDCLCPFLFKNLN